MEFHNPKHFPQDLPKWMQLVVAILALVLAILWMIGFGIAGLLVWLFLIMRRNQH